MIDLNHILLFIAVVSPLILLARVARLRNPRNHGWQTAAAIVLGVCAAAWVVTPTIAGFIGGILWFLLLLLPSLCERKIENLLIAQRLSAARQLAFVRRTFHPWEDSPYQARVLDCLEQAHAGRLDLALDQLALERRAKTPAGFFAQALTFALTENWSGLVQWCRRDPSATANPAVLELYLRALGETGATNDLVAHLARGTDAREPRLTIDLPCLSNLAIALAFTGATPALVRLLAGDLHRMPRDQHRFWLATAELAEGKRDTGVARLEQLRGETRDAVLLRSIAWRLGATPRAEPLSFVSRESLERLILENIGGRRPAPNKVGSATPAVWALILFNVAMFGAELLYGGSTNSHTLHQLGALEPTAVIRRLEYWRLFTALFLHFGILHLGVNLVALYLLGPSLERLIGATKFLISYLLSGLGSSVGVVVLSWLGLTKSELLVGASGPIMGVIGVSAGLLLRHRQSPLAGRQLRNIIAIVAIQTAFDLWSPQISLSAHLCGFISGVVIGVFLASRVRQRVTLP